MNREAFRKIIFLNLKKDYPFMLNTIPYNVEYDGIELQGNLSVVVEPEFLTTHLTDYIDELPEICGGNFAIGLRHFNTCSNTYNFDIQSVNRKIRESYSLLTGDIPHLSNFYVYLTPNCG